MTFYVKCNACDARGRGETRPEAEARIKHALGCPNSENAQRCKRCGERGRHTPRCPYVTGDERRRGES